MSVRGSSSCCHVEPMMDMALPTAYFGREIGHVNAVARFVAA